MFYLSFIYLLLEINIYPSQWVFFISVQFLILFRLIALFVWYSILFIRLYFASKSCQKYIFFGVIFNQTWKQQTFQLKFYTFFLYFSNEFFIVFNFFQFISIGFIFALSSKLCWLLTEIKSIVFAGSFDTLCIAQAIAQVNIDYLVWKCLCLIWCFTFLCDGYAVHLWNIY